MKIFRSSRRSIRRIARARLTSCIIWLFADVMSGDCKNASRLWALSSLGRTEAHILSAVRAVTNVLASLEGSGQHAPRPHDHVCERKEGRRLLERNTNLFLGPSPERRNVRI